MQVRKALDGSALGEDEARASCFGRQFDVAPAVLLNHSDYIEHVNRYSSLGAEMVASAGGGGFSIVNIAIRPWFTFLYNYFFRLGFLDGREGLLLHLYHSAYVSWKYAKAWERARQS